MSSILSVMVDPVRPAHSSRLNKMGCGTKPKASFRSNTDNGEVSTGVLWINHGRMEEEGVLEAAFKGDEPFWGRLMAAKHRVMKQLVVFCRLTGLQLMMTFSYLFLWMGMMEHNFQVEVILFYSCIRFQRSMPIAYLPRQAIYTQHN